jgi:hypothetical protein
MGNPRINSMDQRLVLKSSSLREPVDPSADGEDSESSDEDIRTRILATLKAETKSTDASTKVPAQSNNEETKPLIQDPKPIVAIPNDGATNGISDTLETLVKDSVDAPSPEKSQSKIFICIWSFIQCILKLTNVTFSANRILQYIWRTLINILHVINLVQAPMILAWTDRFYGISWIVAHLFLDFFFMADVYIQAQTQYHDEYGIQISDCRKTRYRYFVTNMGWLDLLSSIPLDLIALTGQSWNAVR